MGNGMYMVHIQSSRHTHTHKLKSHSSKKEMAGGMNSLRGEVSFVSSSAMVEESSGGSHDNAGLETAL